MGNWLVIKNNTKVNLADIPSFDIRHLREKIEINPAEPRYLKVVWAHGYKMEKE